MRGVHVHGDCRNRIYAAVTGVLVEAKAIGELACRRVGPKVGPFAANHSNLLPVAAEGECRIEDVDSAESRPKKGKTEWGAAASAKPPSPVQIRAAPPNFSKKFRD
jgi:hypothetical protein